MDNNDKLYAMRHSLAHIMATAIQHIWPDVKLGVGPVVENGFYYDVDLGENKLSEADFDRIEAEMHKVIDAKQPFERSMKPVDEALAWAHEAHQPYKMELLHDLKREGTTLAKDLDTAMMGLPAGILGTTSAQTITEVSFYTNGDFTDLCRGPHVE